jgi:hypothetical protein
MPLRKPQQRLLPQQPRKRLLRRLVKQRHWA